MNYSISARIDSKEREKLEAYRRAEGHRLSEDAMVFEEAMLRLNITNKDLRIKGVK
jgi:hypothetical protein